MFLVAVSFFKYVLHTVLSLPYNSGLEKALFGELDAVVKYRKILGAMPNRYSYTLLMSIMTDELKHADKYNFLIIQANKNTQ